MQPVSAQFLEDRPLSHDEEARFGHESLADTVVEVIAGCPCPFTIGLYGAWGSGKSTIVNRVAARLSERSIPTVVVDVWKYQADELRRVILNECVRQGKSLNDAGLFDPAFEVDERIDVSISESVSPESRLAEEIREHWAKPNTRLVTVLSLIAATLFLVLLWIIAEAAFAAVAGSVVTVLTLALGYAKFVLPYVSPGAVTKSLKRYEDPYEFQKLFEDVIADGFKSGRVLVVFDNIDRVDDRKAVEVLTTLKTFLECAGTKAVFLVPCDEAAIHQHISSVYDKSPGNADGQIAGAYDAGEFLLKFFNLTMRIPDFLATELESYVADLLARTEVAALKTPDLAWLIALGYRDNPRQAKRFVNCLVADYLLLQNRQGDELPDGFADDRITEMALFEMLTQKFPREMQLADETAAKNPSGLGNSALDELLEQASPIASIDNLPMWFRLRLSSEEQRIAGLSQMEVALEDRKTDLVIAFLQQLDGSSDITEILSRHLRWFLSGKSNPATVLAIVDTLLAALHELQISLGPDLYRQAAGCAARCLPGRVNQVRPSLLGVALEYDLESAHSVAATWADVLNDTDAPEDIVADILVVASAHPDWFVSVRDRVRDALMRLLVMRPEYTGVMSAGTDPGVWLTEQVLKHIAENLGAGDQAA